MQQLKKNFLQRLSMCVALLRIEGDLEKALYSWVKLWKPKKLLDLYEQSPERFAKLPKGNKSILYRQISLPAKMFDKLLSGSKIKGKRALESWSEKQNISSEFTAKRNDFIVTFKKNIPKDQHVVHVPSISLGFNNSNFKNESEVITLAQTLTKKDIFSILPAEGHYDVDKFEQIKEDDYKNAFSLESFLKYRKKRHTSLEIKKIAQQKYESEKNKKIEFPEGDRELKQVRLTRDLPDRWHMRYFVNKIKKPIGYTLYDPSGDIVFEFLEGKT